MLRAPLGVFVHLLERDEALRAVGADEREPAIGVLREPANGLGKCGGGNPWSVRLRTTRDLRLKRMRRRHDLARRCTSVRQSAQLPPSKAWLTCVARLARVRIFA